MLFKKEQKGIQTKEYTYEELLKMPDNELLTLCAEKNEDAFNILAEKYEKFVYFAVWAELKNDEDAFDVSQEVFIRLYNAAGSFRCESTLKTWLYRMCKNCAYDFMRKYYMHKTVSLTQNTDDEDKIEDIPSETTPEEEIIRNEQIKLVRTAINELPEDQREVIVLRELEGMSYTEISDILGINEGTVKSRISRGRDTLRKILEKYL